jgi:hypothetical protein
MRKKFAAEDKEVWKNKSASEAFGKAGLFKEPAYTLCPRILE